MLTRISDYRLASSCLRRICRTKGLSFKDIEVDFDQSVGINSGRICVGKPKNIGQTIYLIISTYINNSKDILGCDLFTDERAKSDFLIHQATLLRRMVYSTNFPQWDEGKPDDAFLQRLYQRSLVWTLMKNIICPLTEKPIKNVVIVAGESPYIDVSHYFKEGEVDEDSSPKEEFIFLNEGIDNEAVKNAHLFVGAIRAHELSPIEVIRNILDADLFMRIAGAVKTALLDDENVDEFSAVLFEILDISPEFYSRDKGGVVTAQAGDTPGASPMQWWYSGLPEKMLETYRGSDWSTYEALHEVDEEFWDEVEKIRSKKPQGEGVAFNDLLRLKQLHTIDTPIDASRSMQSMLASQRIW
jgi:hypothetical protein